MKKLALKVTPKGEVTELDLNAGNELSILQEAVDGLIQPVDFAGFTMWVNEEGLLRNDLEHNFALMAFYQTPIMGNAVFTGGVDDEGNTLPLSERSAELVKSVCNSFRLLMA
jgi:hypothetical protein